MVAANLDAANLKAMDFQGAIREDVLSRIWDISQIPLPFSDSVGSDSIGNDYYSWRTDRLRPPTLGGFVADGADATGNDTNLGARIGNHAGILRKVIAVSTRADESDTIGYARESAYQVQMRLREIRRDVEANALHIQGSTQSDPNAGTPVPGVPAGFGAMCTRHSAGTGATGGAFSNGAWSAFTPGTKRALTETLVRDAAQAAWEDGGDPNMLMSVPAVIRPPK